MAAMLCVGYSDPDEVFIVRNSCGTGWGDKDYCYIPYRYMMNPDYNDSDSWIIERLEFLPPDEETWSEDDASVLEEVSSVLAEMDKEGYEALVEGVGDYHFEQRLALIFLFAAGVDGEFGDDELEIKGYLEPVLEQTGGHKNAAGILKHALKLIEEEETVDEIVDESTDLIWQYFDYDVLASITAQIEATAAADGLAKAERKFIDEFTARWQAEAECDQHSKDEWRQAVGASGRWALRECALRLRLSGRRAATASEVWGAGAGVLSRVACGPSAALTPERTARRLLARGRNLDWTYQHCLRLSLTAFAISRRTDSRQLLKLGGEKINVAIAKSQSDLFEWNVSFSQHMARTIEPILQKRFV